MKQQTINDVSMEIINFDGVMSDCCGSAVIKNKSGGDICADCLEACEQIQVDFKRKVK